MAVGDHILFLRLGVRSSVYDHHAVDVGEGKLIQFAGNKPRDVKNARIWKRDIVDELVSAIAFRIVHPHPKSPEEIVRRAEASLSDHGWDGKPWGFNHNCESFATWCVTGEARCRQKESLLNRFIESGSIGASRPRGDRIVGNPILNFFVEGAIGVGAANVAFLRRLAVQNGSIYGEVAEFLPSKPGEAPVSLDLP